MYKFRQSGTSTVILREVYRFIRERGETTFGAPSAD